MTELTGKQNGVFPDKMHETMQILRKQVTRDLWDQFSNGLFYLRSKLQDGSLVKCGKFREELVKLFVSCLGKSAE